MSRSYKKTPVIKDSSCKGTRFKSGKQLANRAVRNQEDVPNGGSYKKVYCSWNISDWRFMRSSKGRAVALTKWQDAGSIPVVRFIRSSLA